MPQTDKAITNQLIRDSSETDIQRQITDIGREEKWTKTKKKYLK